MASVRLDPSEFEKPAPGGAVHVGPNGEIALPMTVVSQQPAGQDPEEIQYLPYENSTYDYSSESYYSGGGYDESDTAMESLDWWQEMGYASEEEYNEYSGMMDPYDTSGEDPYSTGYGSSAGGESEPTTGGSGVGMGGNGTIFVNGIPPLPGMGGALPAAPDPTLRPGAGANTGGGLGVVDPGEPVVLVEPNIPPLPGLPTREAGPQIGGGLPTAPPSTRVTGGTVRTRPSGNTGTSASAQPQTGGGLPTASSGGSIPFEPTTSGGNVGAGGVGGTARAEPGNQTMTGATSRPMSGPVTGGRTLTTGPLGGGRVGPIPIEQPAGGGDDGGYGPITPGNAINRGAGGILRGAGGLLRGIGGIISEIPIAGGIPGNLLQGGGNIVGNTGRGLSEANNPVTGVVRGAGRGAATTGRGAVGAVAGAGGAIRGTLTGNNLLGTGIGVAAGGPGAWAGVGARGGAGGFNAGTRGVGPGEIWRNQSTQSQAPLPGPLANPWIQSGGASVMVTGIQRGLRNRRQQQNNNQRGGGPGGPPNGNPNPYNGSANPNPTPTFVPPAANPFSGGGTFTPTPFTPFTPQFNPIFPGSPMTRFRPGYNPSDGTYQRQGGYANV